MFFHVCIQNCYEDFYYENAYCGRFLSIEDAIMFISSESFVPPVFDINGYIRWYFPSCGSDGILNNPNEEDDVIECYQIINIIPSEKEIEEIEEFCGNDSRSVYNLDNRRFLLCYNGKVEWL